MSAMSEKIAWITGAGSGIGQAAAAELARDRGRLEALVTQRSNLQQQTQAERRKAQAEADRLAPAERLCSVFGTVQLEVERDEVAVDRAASRLRQSAP